MIESQAQKVVVLHYPGAPVANGSAGTTPVDTLGFDYLELYVVIGAIDGPVTALKLRESDDKATYSDIPETDYSNPQNGQALPTANADNSIYGFHVNGVNGRKRYIDVVLTEGAGATGVNAAIIAILSRGKTMPSDAPSRGLAAELFV